MIGIKSFIEKRDPVYERRLKYMPFVETILFEEEKKLKKLMI